MSDIDRKIAKGAAWMVLFKLVDRGIGVVSTVVLARLLLPADFGLVAMAMTLIGALQLLVAFSFDVALIQNPDAGRDEFDTAWTFNVLFAAACGVVLALLAPMAAVFYNEPRLAAVIYSLAIGFVLQGFSNIGPVSFRREMRFDREFKFLLGKRMATCVTIPLAFYLHNYWALVIGQLTGTVLSVWLSYSVSDYRPRFSLRAKVDLFHKSKWLMVNNLFQFLNNRAGQFILGRYAGAQALGVYSIASEISSLPTTELVAPVNRAAFPGYAKAAGNLAALRASFLNVVSSIAMVALPAGVSILVVADLLVPAALGWKWQSAVPIIQILAIYGVIEAVQNNIGYVYLALGRTTLITWTAGLQFALLVSLLIPGILWFGVLGAAGAFLVTMILMIPVNQYLIARCLGLSALQFVRHVMRPLVASSVMGAVVLLLKDALQPRPVTLDYVMALLLCVAAGALVYAGSLYALWRWAGRPSGPEGYAFARLEDVLRKRGRVSSQPPGA
ncbi:lipopolysaccharide biosynthesis protein [Massilia solisilvae]|uniref:Lipopolysaccharide biosynthesis protein n=1 Tax=Massilia solisilvae TaxID=1811225 RepID=A0ABT2BNE5_9BURK|nr:lipopolysaccharide biosynthesis protein [Massilia solisilvae]MCS0609995.1 lipopolysaccharide biosynthesis protein [Massilia solisilvae]